MGLNAIGDFLHLFTNEPKALFFTVTFICVALTLVAFRISSEGDQNALLLYVCSNCIFYTFYLLKQAPAMAFATISIVYLLRRKYIVSGLLLAIAITFHESAVVLIPLYAMLIFAHNDHMRNISLVIMLITLLFFSGVSRVAFNFINRWLPNLMDEVGGYQGVNGAMAYRLNLVTAIKGIPVYMVFYQSIVKRNTLGNRIACYDQYLVMAGFSSLATLLSSYMYWMWRFGAYCYFPLYLFASELYRLDPDRHAANTFWIMILGPLALFSFRYLCQIFLIYGGF